MKTGFIITNMAPIFLKTHNKIDSMFFFVFFHNHQVDSVHRLQNIQTWLKCRQEAMTSLLLSSIVCFPGKYYPSQLKQRAASFSFGFWLLQLDNSRFLFLVIFYCLTIINRTELAQNYSYLWCCYSYIVIIHSLFLLCAVIKF